MGAEVHLWRVGDGDQLTKVDHGHLDLESRLEEWLERDISILDPALLVIGRQVEAVGGPIDILCIDPEGDLVIVELKRDRTPREVTAQALDYASWVDGLSHEQVTEIANGNLVGGLEKEFRATFEADLPETLNGDHRILVVASVIDSSTERILRYLSEKHGVNINAATFNYFQLDDGPELLARVFVIEPSEVESNTRSKGSSKRQPNLTYEELQKLAVEAGVADLYDHAVGALGAALHKQRRRTAIAFAGDFDGSRSVVMSLIPRDSSAVDGLSYQLYQRNFAKKAGVPPAEVEKLLPPENEPWDASGGADPEFQGFQGFFKTREEIDRIAGALSKAAAPS